MSGKTPRTPPRTLPHSSGRSSSLTNLVTTGAAAGAGAVDAGAVAGTGGDTYFNFLGINQEASKEETFTKLKKTSRRFQRVQE